MQGANLADILPSVKILLEDIRRFSFFLGAALIIGFFDLRGYLDSPKALLESLTTPIQYGLYKSYNKVTSELGFIINARTASQEKKALVDQLAQILSENANLRRKLAEKESQLLQEQSINPNTFETIAAHPISYSRYLKIDKGADSGIKIGQAIVFKDNLIGAVLRVTPKQSEVRLIFDPDSKVAAFVTSDKGRARGILLGQFGSEMLMDKILHSETVNNGDLVYSEGTEGDFPRGLILGVVTKVSENPTQIFKAARVKSVLDIGSLDLVFAIKD